MEIQTVEVNVLFSVLIPLSPLALKAAGLTLSDASKAHALQVATSFSCPNYTLPWASSDLVSLGDPSAPMTSTTTSVYPSPKSKSPALTFLLNLNFVFSTVCWSAHMLVLAISYSFLNSLYVIIFQFVA